MHDSPPACLPRPPRPFAGVHCRAARNWSRIVALHEGHVRLARFAVLEGLRLANEYSFPAVLHGRTVRGGE